MINNSPQFTDKILTCCDCGETFVFEAGEQAYFRSKQLSEPKRCPECRRIRKASIVADRGWRNG